MEPKVGRPLKPISQTSPELAQFCVDLRQLWHEAGEPTYQDMADRAHVAKSGLSSVTSGDTAPSWTMVRAWIRGCGHTAEGRWERQYDAMLVAWRARQVAAATSTDHPLAPIEPGTDPGDLPPPGSSRGTVEEMYTQLARLRRGSGLHTTSAVSDIAPSLFDACGIPLGLPAGEARRRLADRLAVMIRDLPPDLALGVQAALAMPPASQGRFLRERMQWFGDQIQRDPRTALRRVDSGLQLLAERLVASQMTPSQRDWPLAEPVSPRAPRELPSNLAGFVGREAEMAQLDHVLTGPGTRPGVLAIVGMAGVGKTALALHWGHRRQDQFPDGSLYVDLRGYDPSQPVEPAAALARLLRSLGLNDADQPTDVDERAAHYRTLLAGRRVLVVLDNVRDSEQVRLLLPGASSGATLITTRARLGLITDQQRASRLELDVLSPAASEHLLHELLADPQDPDPTADLAAVHSVVAHCAGLPLALRIAAALARERQGGLRSVAADLSDDRNRLNLLDDGNARGAVRSVLSWSFRTLDDQVSRTFRLLGLSPAPEMDEFAAAALTNLPVAVTRQHLTALLRAQLLQEREPGRLMMHDLLRDYARDQAIDDPTEQASALQRLRAYYLAGAENVRTHIMSETPRFTTSPSMELPPLDSPDLAMSWFDHARPGILAMVPLAFADQDFIWICRIADALWRTLAARGFYAEAAQLHQGAREAARRWGEPGWEALALEHLGVTEEYLGRYDDSLRHLEEAAELSRACGDWAAQARTLISVGTVHARHGSYERAIDVIQRGYMVTMRIGDEQLQARALNNIGLVYQRWGRYADALETLNRSVELAERLNQTQLLAIALNNRGLVLRLVGRRAQGRDDILAALRLAESIGDLSLLAEVLNSLGALLLEDDEPEAAVSTLEQALAMHRESEDRAAMAEALDNLGVAQQRLGRPNVALDYHAEAMRLAEAIGDRNRLGNAQIGLGLALRQLGRHAAAAKELTGAVELARELGNTDQEARALAGLALSG